MTTTKEDKYTIIHGPDRMSLFASLAEGNIVSFNARYGNKCLPCKLEVIIESIRNADTTRRHWQITCTGCVISKSFQFDKDTRNTNILFNGSYWMRGARGGYLLRTPTLI
jgi:hypothetical protein